MSRVRLPARRRNEIRDIEFAGRAYSVCVGFRDDGSPAEVFADGPKEGSDIRHTLSDACVLISIALQHGVSRTELDHSIGRVPCWVNGKEGDRPASIIGAVIEAIEANGGDAMNGFEAHNITHLSPSSLNLWINAPALWVAEKIFKHRGPASPAMARGIAVEDAVVAVVAHGKSEEDAVISALRNFDSRFFIGTDKTTAERDLVAPMVSRALAVLAPLGEPEFPDGGGQMKIELVCNCGDFKIPVIGFLDLFYPQHGRVIDIKTTQRMPSRMSTEHVLQRCIYARAKQNHAIEFLYVTPAKTAFLADGEVSDVLARVKFHARRLEAFLRLLDREQMRAIVPLNDGSFYFQGNTALTEIYGLASP